MTKMDTKFADNTTVGWAVDCFKSREGLQRDLDKLEAGQSQITWSLAKASDRLCTWGNPGYMYRLGCKRLESSPVEKGVWVLIHSKLSMSQNVPW